MIINFLRNKDDEMMGLAEGIPSEYLLIRNQYTVEDYLVSLKNKLQKNG